MRSARQRSDVTLVAVTKYVGVDVIRELIELGQTHLGENRPQQLAARAAELAAAAAESPAIPLEPRADRPVWHMIGHLQRNKVKQTLAHSRIIHSVDSVRLADEIATQAERLNLIASIFVEVNIAGEAAKGGVSPPEAAALVAHVHTRPTLRPLGLMAMAPLDAPAESARPHFARLRGLRDDFITHGTAPVAFGALSMGMTQDFVVAIEEGATHVRVGSALFEGITREISE